MNLNLSYQDFCKNSRASIICLNSNELRGSIDEIVFDSRRIVFTKNVLFAALKGDFRDGHDFILDAYNKGVRCFLVSKEVNLESYPEAIFFRSISVLDSLQSLASWNRNRSDTKVIAVAGSHGKTTVKEWLYHLLSSHYRVYRSPKSYNSQLGVSISLLQLTNQHDYAIIEVGFSLPGEMKKMKKMIVPDYGVLTSFSPSSINSFKDQNHYNNELISLMVGVKCTIANSLLGISKEQKNKISLLEIDSKSLSFQQLDSRWQNQVSIQNLSLAFGMAEIVGVNKEDLLNRVSTIPSLAMRLETYDGINNSIIINDAYNLDINALSSSLAYQKAIATNKRRIVVIALDSKMEENRLQIQKEVNIAKPDIFIELNSEEEFDLDISNAVVLLKGNQNSFIKKIAQKIKKQTHSTILEINLTAIRENLSYFRKKTSSKTKLLCRVKAQSYGSGLEKMALFLEAQGISYLGVACVDEGVELRKSGVQIPILVLNMQQENFKSCIDYNLEPAIYSFVQLDRFIRELIDHKKTNFPIHLKFDTGMHRLGFNIKETSRVLEMIKSQPEVIIKGVFSHLADSGSAASEFTMKQIQCFEKIKKTISDNQSSPIIFHLLNTDGILNYNQFQYDMVRLGIGMYGISSNEAKELKPVFSWKTIVSQVKKIEIGDYVGYSKGFKSNKAFKIAVIPVGYADGFRRILKNGQGGVYINGVFCKTVGNICMDMTMIDIGENKFEEGDLVEIIGESQSISKLARNMQTIPYEILTGISKRVHRVYIED